MTPPDDHDHTLADPPPAATPSPVLAAAALLERLRACELLDASQWAETAAAPAATLPDARVLARDLIQRGWLTPFQANQLFQDRGAHLVLESYVLLERLGEGGMGQVFKARHRKLGHVVAVKVIRKDRLLNPDIVKRFRREIRTTSQMAHPNIVRALDAGEGGGAYYFAMEFIDGVDLSKLVRRGGMLPPRAACEYMRQAALALHYAHEHGIVHRDVKPSNLLLRADTPEPVVMILDLGLARRLDREGADNSTTLTDEGAVMGTPDYIAPEQAEESHTVDGRADVYSLGCTLYYLLNAKPPFSGTSLATKLRQHLFVEPTPVEQLRNDLPPGLAFVVRKMMAKRPEDRYQTAAEVAAALAAVFQDVPTAVPIVETPTAPLAIPLGIPGDDKTVALPTTVAWRRKPSWMLLGLGGAATGLMSVLFVIAVVVFFLFPRKPSDTAQPPPPPPDLKEWEVALSKLHERANKPDENRAALSEDVSKFQQKYNREPNALLGGAALLHTLPSPLDKLDAKAIPEDERYPWQPPELVAVIGTQRFRHWTPLHALAWDESSAAPISASADSLYFWDATGRLLKMEPMEVRPDGLTISSGKEPILAGMGRDGNIRLWKRRDKALAVWHNIIGPGYYGRIALTPDGTLLAAGHEKRVTLWNLAGMEPSRLPDVGTVSEKRVVSVAIRPDGKWLAASDEEGRIKLWVQQDGAWNEKLDIPAEQFGKNPEANLRSFTFQPEGNLFVACSNRGGCAYRWDLSQPSVKPKEFSYRQGGGGLAFTADGKTLVVAWAFEGFSQLQFWTELDAMEPKLAGHYSSSQAGANPVVVFSKDQKTVCAALTAQDYGHRNAALLLGDRSDRGWKERLLPGLTSAVGGLVFAADGRTLLTGGAGAADQRLPWWRVTDNQFSAAGSSPVGWWGIAGLSLASDREDQLLVGFGNLVFWSKWTGTGLSEPIPCRNISGVVDGSVALSLPRLATLQRNAGITVFDVSKSPEQGPLRVPVSDADPTCLALSPNGHTLVTGCRNGPVRIWQLDGKNGKERVAFKQPLSRLTFHPDGKSLIGGCCDGLIRVWNVEEPESIAERYHLDGHGGEVTRLVLAPDGATLASADAKNRLIVWDLKGRKELVNHVWPGAVTSLAFAPDGRHLAVGMSNGVTYILRVHPTPQ